jgi:AbrB family looped-hinge helix DNA binding protein
MRYNFIVYVINYNMQAIKTIILESGIVIPTEYRKELGLEVGDEVMIQLVDGEIRIFTLQQAVKRSQEIVSQYVPEQRSLSNELIEERRQESLLE